MKVFEEIVQLTKAYYCIDCGICTGSCPVARVNPRFSPRLNVEKSLLQLEGEIVEDRELWSCLTCGTCSYRCPALVDYQSFVLSSRIEARKAGREGMLTHDGVLKLMMELQTFAFPQTRTNWIPKEVKTSAKGEYLYWVGCLPHFDVIFKDYGTHSLQSAVNALRILNRLGIKPVVSPEERCCGHDLLWNGDIESFRKLARHNIGMIKKYGVSKVICSCPEGYRTLKVEYPKLVGDTEVEVIHISQLIAQGIKEGKLFLNPLEQKVTYHDPCRLGRLSGIYEEPREVIRHIPGLQLLEMERNRVDAICCGTTGWVNCTSCSKQIQTDRLKEAISTGAQTLITACPKCKIHFQCALMNSDLSIEIKDMLDLVGEVI